MPSRDGENAMAFVPTEVVKNDKVQLLHSHTPYVEPTLQTLSHRPRYGSESVNWMPPSHTRLSKCSVQWALLGEIQTLPRIRFEAWHRTAVSRLRRTHAGKEGRGFEMLLGSLNKLLS